jgi:hypothetical protein
MLQIDRQVAVQRRIVDVGRAAAPDHLARQRAAAAFERARLTDPFEQGASILDVELEIEHGALRGVFVGIGAKSRRGAPVRGCGQGGGGVADIELVQLPDRDAIFFEVMRIDFQAAYIVVAHDQLVHDQIDRRHVLRRRRHRLAEQVIFGGGRNHETGEARLQRARRALDRTGQPRDVS